MAIEARQVVHEHESSRMGGDGRGYVEVVGTMQRTVIVVQEPVGQPRGYGARGGRHAGRCGHDGDGGESAHAAQRGRRGEPSGGPLGDDLVSRSLT